MTARILVADDSALIRKSLKLILSAHRDWVICGEASDGQEAVVMAKELKPDLIVLDLVMPVLNGLQASVEILQASPNIPIVIYTLHQNEQVELQSKQAGARRVVYKGDDATKLVLCVGELLGEADATQPVTPGDEAPADDDGGSAGTRRGPKNSQDSRAKARGV